MTKHIVVISDGDPAPPTASVMSQLVQSKVTVTTILITSHSNDSNLLSVMRNMALRTKGRFYNVTNPRALPRSIKRKRGRSRAR